MLSTTTSSSMTLFRLNFRLLLIVCCIIVITSYKINHRPFEDRNQRAVTEWRFRRNFLFPFPAFYPTYANAHWGNNDEIENGNDAKIYNTKDLPHALYEQNK